MDHVNHIGNKISLPMCPETDNGLHEFEVESPKVPGLTHLRHTCQKCGLRLTYLVTVDQLNEGQMAHLEICLCKTGGMTGAKTKPWKMPCPECGADVAVSKATGRLFPCGRCKWEPPSEKT